MVIIHKEPANYDLQALIYRYREVGIRVATLLNYPRIVRI